MRDMCSSTRQDRKGVTGVVPLCPPHLAKADNLENEIRVCVERQYGNGGA